MNPPVRIKQGFTLTESNKKPHTQKYEVLCFNGELGLEEEKQPLLRLFFNDRRQFVGEPSKRERLLASVTNRVTDAHLANERELSKLERRIFLPKGKQKTAPRKQVAVLLFNWWR